MRLKDRFLLAVAPPLAYVILRIIYLLNRIDVIGLEHPTKFWSEGENVILVFWHEELLLMVQGYRGPKANVLVSASKDGDLGARLMHLFGQDTVRGSSSKGGRAAFKEMLALSRNPVDLVIIPDGPRGPRRELKEGVIHLARITGRPVIPMTFACSRGRRFNSWDKCLLPYPFGRGVYAYGEPIWFDKEEGEEIFRNRLVGAMDDLQQQAKDFLEGFGVSAV